MNGATILVLLLLFAALGPGKWQYRTGLGWRIDHVVGYFVFTLGFWLAWPRPFLVGGALVVAGILLEALQALTPDRHCDFQGALYSASGALAAGLVAHFVTRALPRLRRAAFDAAGDPPSSFAIARTGSSRPLARGSGARDGQS
jgi:hypothetical protein